MSVEYDVIGGYVQYGGPFDIAPSNLYGVGAAIFDAGVKL